jgi:nitroimidazol reductase NimA-like FMN-containing flavoprotein (pyridoxamine 5'-phosphate oxidase superfamily)
MSPEHLHPRRRDRSKDEEWIKALLHRGEAGVFSAVLEGAPVALPRIFVYDEARDAIYVHGAFGGLTGRVLAQGGGEDGVPMAATVYEMGRFLPADEALEFGVEYASVVVSGTAREVSDLEEVGRALRLIMEKYAPHLDSGKDYRPVESDEIVRTAVVRIDIQAWSGKQKTAPENFPGAYWLKDVR